MYIYIYIFDISSLRVNNLTMLDGIKFEIEKSPSAFQLLLQTDCRHLRNEAHGSAVG